MLEQLLLQTLRLQNDLVGASRLAHWNIVGPEFYSFHLMFEKIYGIAGGTMDSLAEQARGCGVEIKAYIFNSVPEIDWEGPIDLSKKLYELNEDFNNSLYELRDEAEKDGKYGLVNIIEGMMSDSNSIKYLLGSVLESL